MDGIGKLLKEKREAGQLSLAEVEQGTKIRQRYLEALEAEAFDVLPGNVYLYGFLRSYATFLGLDADYIIAQVRAQAKEAEDKSPSVYPLREDKYLPKTRKVGRALKIIAVLLALLLGGSFLLNNLITKPNEGITSPSVNDPSDEVLLGEEKGSAPIADEQSDEENIAAILPDDMEVVLSVAEQNDARCWVEVRADDETVFSGILEAGEIKEFRAQDKLWVKIGNPGVLSVSYNGKDLGKLGPDNKVVTLEFPVATGHE